MPRISSPDRSSRLRFDFQIVQRMNQGGQYQFSAHRNARDALRGDNAILRVGDAHLAEHYRARFGIPTLIGQKQFSDYTILHIDVSAADYPFTEPTAWVVRQGESRTPWSPHFAEGLPVCNGNIWRADGQVTLGHYVVHLAHLLNWEEPLADAYGGYRPEAVAWWRKHYNRPLNRITYPVLPLDLLYGENQVVRGGGFRRA